MSLETRKEILDLLAGGKISVDEAATLLSQAVVDTSAGAPPEPPAAPEPPEPPEQDWQVEEGAFKLEKEPALEAEPELKPKQKPGWFRVRVNNLETGKSKVSVNIPVRMLKFGFTVASHFTPQMDVNMRELEEMLADGERGILVDVRDEESNEHVQLYLD